MESTQTKPNFTHDCDKCVFLGDFQNERDGLVDLYYHGGPPETVIARWGSDGPQYVSGLPFAVQGIIPSLVEALRRAVEMGLRKEQVVMKDFSYYTYKPTVTHVSRSFKLQELKDAVDQQRLTVDERNTAYRQADAQATAWYQEQQKEPRAEQARLEAEFWADCREDLGYADVLGPKGVKAIEAMAWENGHSSGYSEVHGVLWSLSDLITACLSDLPQKATK